MVSRNASRYHFSYESTDVFRVSLVFLAQGALAAAQSPRGKAELTLNGVTMTIDYGQPSLRGRDVLSEAPKGFVWRLGADEATLLTLTD